MSSARRLSFRGCVCCTPLVASSSQRRPLPSPRVRASAASSGGRVLSAATPGSVPNTGAGSGSSTRERNQAASHRHPSPRRAAEIHRGDARAAAAADHQLDAGEDARRHGRGRRRHLDHLDHHARRLDRRQRTRPPRRARVQRLFGQARRRSSRPLRHVRGAAAARHRRQPARDRARPRRAQGRRHRALHQLSRQMAGRSRVRAGDGGIEPPQGAGVHPSGGAALLPRAHPRHQRGGDRIRHRHRARDRAAAVHRHRLSLPRHQVDLLARRRLAADVRRPLRARRASCR